MSEISDAIRGSILLADYAVSDALGKVNMVGGSVSVIGFDFARGMSAPFAVWATLLCAWPAPDSNAAVEVVLVDAMGEPYSIPGPNGSDQVMRIGQNVEFSAPTVPGALVPRGALDSAAQVILNFGSGLPLPVGQGLAWNVLVDGELKATAKFFIPAPQTGPVVG